ncbi:SCO family protein [Effusibacillus consociatus]|uniref:SCO family protein n=1 Tax=Effusibacillus consociatus TaxID=1117041 RepID=A0ABV9Q1C3_9BACL
MLVTFVAGISYWLWWGTSRLPVVDRAPNWTLQNINGQREVFQDLGSRVKLIEFIFLNCPDICPTTTINMVKMQEELKRKQLFGTHVAFVGITFDPERDNPELIKKYANNLMGK